MIYIPKSCSILRSDQWVKCGSDICLYFPLYVFLCIVFFSVSISLYLMLSAFLSVLFSLSLMILMNSLVDWRTGIGTVGGEGTECWSCLESEPALHLPFFSFCHGTNEYSGRLEDRSWYGGR